MNFRPLLSNIHFLFITGGFAINSLLAVVYRYINAGSPFIPLNEWGGYYGQGWPIMLQTFIILYFVYYSIRYFNKRFIEAPNSFKRFLIEILFILLVGFAIMEIFHWIFVTFMVVPEQDMQFLQRRLKMIQTIDVTFLIVIYAFMTSFRIFRYLQRKNMELLQWQKEYAQTQFEAVKNQLNPHFLFNSLNALSSLVWVDANKAEQFIEKLSRSYRYLLEQRDKKLVPLSEELQFLDSFLFLMQERFGNKLHVSFQDINPGGKRLLPHSLMIVFDYLLATNSMSTAKPLLIDVAQETDTLDIRFNRQPKAGNNLQAQEQLERLKEQYQFNNRLLQVAETETAKGLIQIPFL